MAKSPSTRGASWPRIRRWWRARRGRRNRCSKKVYHFHIICIPYTVRIIQYVLAVKTAANISSVVGLKSVANDVWLGEDDISLSWCQYRSMALTSINSTMVTDKFLFLPDRSSRHVYVVPRSCIEWKSSYKAIRVYPREANIMWEYQLTVEYRLF